MKLKIGIAVAVVVLIALQLVFGGRKKGASAPSGASAPVAAGAPAALPKPEDAAAIEIGGPAGVSVALDRTDAGWTVRQLGGAPALSAKVDELLRTLLSGTGSPVAATQGPDVTGLVDDEGVRVAVTTAAGGAATFAVGLRPEGNFTSTYVRMPGGALVLADGDLRAELGLWKNRPGETPSPLAWLDTCVFRFDPEQVVSLTATYPDHTIAFAKRPGEGENAPAVWRLETPAPGGEWSEDGLRRWLADLADFRISGVADAEDAETREGQIHGIVLGFADGTEKSIRVVPSHAGEGAVAVVSDRPGRAFTLPNWRFRKYFGRIGTLFPNAVPHFDLSEVRFLDVRDGGESVKIMRRDNGWEPVALPYELKSGQIERLARFLSTWRSEDYADPDAKSIRPSYGGPMVEIVLAKGEVHQYRLSGRHPVFPWRYVTLDGKRILTVSDAEAGVMFPSFSDILELGPVFPALERGEAKTFELRELSGPFRIRFSRDGAGAWTAETETGVMPLDRATADELIADLQSWRVAGFHRPGFTFGVEDPSYGITVGTDAEESGITLFRPFDRDIPYVTDGERHFLLDRAEFHNWLVSVKDIGARVNEHAAFQAEEQRKAEERAKAEERERAQAEAEAKARAEAKALEEAKAREEAEQTAAPALPVEAVATESETTAPAPDAPEAEPAPEPEAVPAATEHPDEGENVDEEEPEPAPRAEEGSVAAEPVPDEVVAPAVEPALPVVDVEAAPSGDGIDETAEPARKIVPSEVDFSGRIYEKAAQNPERRRRR